MMHTTRIITQPFKSKNETNRSLFRSSGATAGKRKWPLNEQFFNGVCTEIKQEESTKLRANESIGGCFDISGCKREWINSRIVLNPFQTNIKFYI